MNTAGLNLNAREALESSLSFLGHFLKQYWPLALLYVVIGIVPAFIIGDEDVSDLALEKRIQLGIITMVNIIPSMLMIYYAFRDALPKLDPSSQISNKSLAKAFWQIFCINIITAVVSVPLFILFILPGVWWSTKASVAFANLLSTNDGPIMSIRKSHQLMDGKFWTCFGFLVATSSAVILVTTIGGMTIAFFLLMGGMLNALFHEGAGLNRIMNIFRIMGPLIAVFSSVVFYYIQAWLYVYLKQDNAVSVTTV